MSQLSRPAAPPCPPTLLLAFWLAMGPAVAIGFGRFGYALVLPAMKTDLALTYAQAGALNTANAGGYLLGALLCGPLARVVPARMVMLGGLAASVMALALAGLFHDFHALLACRALVGASAAFTFIAATVLAAALGKDSRENALAMGMVIGGAGFGVIMTGMLVPFTIAGSTDRWPRAWLTMAAIGAVLWLGVAYFTRFCRPAVHHAETETGEGTEPAANFAPLLATLVAYFCFGLGYIAYMTFLVAYVRSRGSSPGVVALAWSCLGVSMCASSFAWRGRLGKERSGLTMALMGAGGGLSALVLLFSDSLGTLLLSAIGFGMTAMPMFTAVAILIRMHLAPRHWAQGIALATLIFALGQGLGPVGSGWAADHYGPKASLIWTFVIMTIGGIVALTQRAHVAE